MYRGGNFFFCFFFGTGVKLDEKSIENGLEGQKFLVVCLFWGGCHHPNITDYKLFQRILNNGDFYDNHGNRIIDGEIHTVDGQSDDLDIPIIETRFKILAVCPLTSFCLFYFCF